MNHESLLTFTSGCPLELIALARHTKVLESYFSYTNEVLQTKNFTENHVINILILLSFSMKASIIWGFTNLCLIILYQRYNFPQFLNYLQN